MQNTNKLTRQDKEALLQYTKHFIRKSVQIIVQSRLGEKKPTKSRVHAYNSDWFNLSIKDLLQITTMTKASLGTESIFNLGSPYCIEISLKTPENQTMILETWCILFNEQLCDQSQKVCFAVYKKMSLVLRSLLCMTRSMPTYQLSRRQSSDTYVLLYRMYCGEPIVHNLGEKYATAKCGSIGTPIGTVMLNVAYRTRLTMTPQNTSTDTIFIKDDHFFMRDDLNTQSVIQQRPSTIRFACDSNNTSDDSQTTATNTGQTTFANQKKRSQPIQMTPNASQEYESPTQQQQQQQNDSSEDYSRNSSVASTPSDTMYYLKLKSAVFAPATANNLTITSTFNEIPPFISLLCNDFTNMSPLTQQPDRKAIEANPNQMAQSPPPPVSTLEQNLDLEKPPEYTPQTEDYVYIESKKIAFGLSDAATDLSNFFRSCENVPILESFNTEPNLIDTLKDLDAQLLQYESKVSDFDELVKSLEAS